MSCDFTELMPRPEPRSLSGRQCMGPSGAALQGSQ